MTNKKKTYRARSSVGLTIKQFIPPQNKPLDNIYNILPCIDLINKQIWTYFDNLFSPSSIVFMKEPIRFTRSPAYAPLIAPPGTALSFQYCGDSIKPVSASISTAFSSSLLSSIHSISKYFNIPLAMAMPIGSMF